MIQSIRPLDDKIVVYGMSCSGKTTFALELKEHPYCCFDALFPWDQLETMGLSIRNAAQTVLESCGNHFVLDGWSLYGGTPNANVYVVYAPYTAIIAQYRIEVTDPDEYRGMYKKWYLDIDYQSLNARYFLNNDNFIETTYDDFSALVSVNSEN